MEPTDNSMGIRMSQRLGKKDVGNRM
jgi:hypothetical protein